MENDHQESNPSFADLPTQFLIDSCTRSVQSLRSEISKQLGQDPYDVTLEEPPPLSDHTVKNPGALMATASVCETTSASADKRVSRDKPFAELTGVSANQLSTIFPKSFTNTSRISFINQANNGSAHGEVRGKPKKLQQKMRSISSRATTLQSNIQEDDDASADGLVVVVGSVDSCATTSISPKVPKTEEQTSVAPKGPLINKQREVKRRVCRKKCCKCAGRARSKTKCTEKAEERQEPSGSKAEPSNSAPVSSCKQQVVHVSRKTGEDCLDEGKSKARSPRSKPADSQEEEERVAKSPLQKQPKKEVNQSIPLVGAEEGGEISDEAKPLEGEAELNKLIDSLPYSFRERVQQCVNQHRSNKPITGEAASPRSSVSTNKMAEKLRRPQKQLTVFHKTSIEKHVDRCRKARQRARAMTRVNRTGVRWTGKPTIPQPFNLHTTTKKSLAKEAVASHKESNLRDRESGTLNTSVYTNGRAPCEQVEECSCVQNEAAEEEWKERVLKEIQQLQNSIKGLSKLKPVGTHVQVPFKHTRHKKVYVPMEASEIPSDLDDSSHASFPESKEDPDSPKIFTTLEDVEHYINAAMRYE